MLHLIYTKTETPSESSKTEEKPTENILERLVINVSQSCNLQCRYCYAGGGDYGQAKPFMSQETALKTLDRF